MTRLRTLIHTGADAKGGQWPFWCWAAVGLGEEAAGYRPRIVVAEEDWKPLGLDMKERLRSVCSQVVVGPLEPYQFIECGLVISGDTEAREMAVEMGIPSISLYGPTEPQGDWWEGGPHHLLWAPGSPLRAISLIDVEREICAVRRRLRVGMMDALRGTLCPEPLVPA